MEEAQLPDDDEKITVDLVRTQIERFTGADSRCQALALPEGLMLRYRMLGSLYFYLRSGVRDGKITTRIYASDSPYERQKSLVGEVLTPMFETDANSRHLDRIQELLYSWVDFVGDAVEPGEGFSSFEFKERPD